MSRLIGAVLAAALGAAPVLGQPKDEEVLAAGQRRFAAALYRQLAGREGNLFVSPFSAWTALTMTSAGARGETLAQMRSVLGHELPEAAVHERAGRLAASEPGSQGAGRLSLVSANRIWLQQGLAIDGGFRSLLEQRYGAAPQSVDFAAAPDAAAERINQWVEETTGGRIRQLFPPGVIDRSSRLVLANAVSFVGQWQQQFDRAETRPEDFHVAPGRTVRVPTMHQSGRLRYAEAPEAQILEMGYRDGTASMIVLLPREGRTLADLEAGLDGAALDRWTAAPRDHLVEVALPRFSFETALRLDEVLAALGMLDAFAADRADFGGISPRERLVIQAVMHKAFVAVDEHGTEAAAATGVAIGIVSAPPGPVSFRADRPFLFLIRDAGSGAILFMGRVEDPTR